MKAAADLEEYARALELKKEVVDQFNSTKLLSKKFAGRWMEKSISQNRLARGEEEKGAEEKDAEEVHDEGPLDIFALTKKKKKKKNTWDEYWEPVFESGIYYFHNTMTGECQLNDPLHARPIEDESLPCPAAPAEGMGKAFGLGTHDDDESAKGRWGNVTKLAGRTAARVAAASPQPEDEVEEDIGWDIESWATEHVA